MFLFLKTSGWGCQEGERRSQKELFCVCVFPVAPSVVGRATQMAERSDSSGKGEVQEVERWGGVYGEGR